MKPSTLERALSLAGTLFLFISVYGKAVGLPALSEWVAPMLAIACFVPLIVLRRRRRNARLAAGLSASERTPPPGVFWLLLAIIVGVTLSGPFWLPSTDIHLPFSILVVSSIISCVFAVLVFVFSWRYWNKKV